VSRSPDTLLLFNFDWDSEGFARHADAYPQAEAGFDLFSFPSNTRLAYFDLDRFVASLAGRARRRGWRAVTSQHEQFGALAAALLAERMGWPGTPPDAVLACQHKLHARRVLAEVCPEAGVAFGPIDARYGGPIPNGLPYPLFAKPVKAAFSVLAKRVASHAELHAHTRFGRGERWVIHHLVEPFERVARRRLPQAGSAHRLLWEEALAAPQFNLDGYVWQGEAHALGVVDSIMYPDTQAFMRFDYPSRLAPAVQARALAVAARFLKAVGFTHGLFNMEFFFDSASDRLAVIEFNPRLASQLADLYRRVDGSDPHAMALALAHGENPATAPRVRPGAGAASSFVFRHFSPSTAAVMPTPEKRREFAGQFPDGRLLIFPKHGNSLARDYKWLGSHRYAVLHLGGRDPLDLELRCRTASRLLGWPAPYAESSGAAPADAARPLTRPAIAGATT
jgi:hypothetical protein